MILFRDRLLADLGLVINNHSKVVAFPASKPRTNVDFELNYSSETQYKYLTPLKYRSFPITTGEA